jgi:hypothetical protein
MGVLPTPTLIIFYTPGPVALQTEIRETQEPAEQKNQRTIFSEA